MNVTKVPDNINQWTFADSKEPGEKHQHYYYYFQRGMIRCPCQQHGNRACLHRHCHRSSPPQMSLDRLELSVDGGRVKIFVQIGHYDKTLIIGQVIMIMMVMTKSLESLDR